MKVPIEQLLDERQKKDLDSFIGFAVKAGALYPEVAERMSYDKKWEYREWCDYKGNEKDD